MSLHLILLVISYGALLLLLIPATSAGILSAAALFILVAVLIIFKKPRIEKDPCWIIHFLASVFFAAYLGWRFYNQWILSSIVHLIAAKLHLPPYTLVVLGTWCLPPFACYSVFWLLGKVMGMLIGIKEHRRFERDLFFCFLSSAVTVALAQFAISEPLLSMGLPKFLWGTLTVAIFILAIYALTRKITVSVVVGSGLFMFISTVNVYVYSFRQRLFEPIDIYSVRTVMNVAGNYSLFPIPLSLIISYVLWLTLILFVSYPSFKAKFTPSPKKRIALLVCCLIGLFAVSRYTSDLYTYHWDKQGATYNGYVLDFVSKIKEAYVPEPDGYDPEQVQILAAQYHQDAVANPEDHSYPHIIVIMNEAFSDLSVHGEISTNKEVLPFVSSLEEDTIRGYSLVSIYGGNTSNSEYEFLTGNSMAWMSPNAVPYQQYLNTPSYSMVSYLKTNYSYHCIAMHPHLSSGWNRPTAYSNLGFDESLFIDDFPQKQYVRRFISDREMYEKLVEIYETKHDQPLFVLGITMQNHGDYENNGDNYDHAISLVGYENAYPDVEQYLSLIHESDKAVEYLISYFSTVDDDVIIVFFGDHQPAICEDFLEEIGGAESNSLDKQQKRYMVPFFIWANYDINEADIQCIGLNNLSSYVYNAAGIPLPPYNRFLTQMEQVIPVMNAHGFYQLESQSFVPFSFATEEEKRWLNTYEFLQYNNVFDNKHKNPIFFPIGN